MIVDAANFSQNSLSNSPQNRPLIMCANNRYYAGMTLKEAKVKDLEKSFWRRDFHNIDKNGDGVLSVDEIMNERKQQQIKIAHILQDIGLDDELIEKIDVRGVSWSGTDDNTGVVITAVFETPNGLKTCINTPRIKMATISFGFEEELETIVESIKKEVYAYLFKGKQAQMSLFGDNGADDDEPDPLDNPDDMPAV